MFSVTKCSHSKRLCLLEPTTAIRFEKSLSLVTAFFPSFRYIPVKNLKFPFRRFFQFGSPAGDNPFPSLSPEIIIPRRRFAAGGRQHQPTSEINKTIYGLQYRYTVSIRFIETFKIYHLEYNMVSLCNGDLTTRNAKSSTLWGVAPCGNVRSCDGLEWVKISLSKHILFELLLQYKNP